MCGHEFVPLSNNNYLLVHKWGKDLSWHKKILAFPLRNIETILLTIAATSLIIAILSSLESTNTVKTENNIFLPHAKTNGSLSYQ